MTFKECVLECAKKKKLVAEFDRLQGSNLSMKGGPVVPLIDKTTGKLNDDLAAFVLFVHDAIWTRLPATERTEPAK